MPKNKQRVESKVRSILSDLTKDERVFLQRVIQIEKSKIHMKTPHGIYDDIRDALDQVIQ